MKYDILRDGNNRILEMNGRRIVFPTVRDFAALFPATKPYSPAVNRKSRPVMNLSCGPGTNRARFRVSDSLRIEDIRKNDRRMAWFSVKISKTLADFIKKSVLRVTYDTMTFQVYVWPRDKDALVILEHGQIIGCHYLAIVDRSTVPQFPKEGDE